MLTEITTLDICNLALSKLGESPLNAIDANGSPASRQCYLHYHPTRREVLCAHRWSFAQKLVTISSSEDEDEKQNERTLYHQLPADCLRVLNVNQSNWTMRGRGIYSKDKDIKLLYTYDCEDPELFEALFIDALATRLAFKMCISLTSSTTARTSLLEEYKKVCLPEAAHFNAVQSCSNDTHPLYQLWKNNRNNNN